MNVQLSLWGDEFKIPDNTKKIIKKLDKPVDIKKTLNSKKTSIEDKLLLIEKEVNRVLGRYKDNIMLIKTKEELHNYISAAIENDLIAIDTETNNSLDTYTCMLMGACLYTPNQKQVYIPINHVNLNTKERLSWQLTEQDLYEEFKRLDNTKIITHNYQFDYKVIYFTTGWKMPLYWDTAIGARMLDENEVAKLKEQYRLHVDPTQEKYDIEHLFQHLEYAIIDPELFAYYASQDAYDTLKLMEYQKKEFEKEDNKRIYDIFKNVEIPVLSVLNKMEMNGIDIDEEYSRRLSIKYNRLLKEAEERLNQELLKLEPQISAWKKTPDANSRTTDKKGKLAPKTKLEQLDNPISLTSPTQLAILLYDILKVPIIDKSEPRGTGKEILQELEKKYHICKLLLEHRSLHKMLDAFIDALPGERSKRDNKIHGNINSCGTDTGRQSMKEPNLQQIPAKNDEIRLMFTVKPTYGNSELKDNCYSVKYTDEVKINENEWVKAKNLKIGDKVFNSEKDYDTIKDIKSDNKFYYIYI